MTISRLASQDAKGTSATASVSATYPSTPTQNNLLVASARSGTATGTIAISGWTLYPGTDQQVGDLTASMALFYKIAGAGESTGVTATATGSASMRLHIYERNSTTGWAVGVTDGTNFGNSGASAVTSRNTGSITTANADDYLFAACAVNATVSSMAWDNSFTLQQQDATVRLFDGDRIVSSTGSYSSTASWTTGTKATAIVCAFQAAPTASTTKSFAALGVG